MENTTQKDQGTVILFVKVAAKPGSIEKASKALLADVYGARTEAGNYKMELYQSKETPGNFYLIERWKDRSALEAHFNQPYTAAAFELQQADLVAPIEMNYLTDLWPTPQIVQKRDHEPLTTLIVPFEVKPGNGQALIRFFEDFVPAVRKEPGNVEFHFHSVAGSETKFVLYERWERPEDLEAHNSLPSTAALVASITPLLTQPVADFILFTTNVS